MSQSSQVVPVHGGEVVVRETQDESSTRLINVDGIDLEVVDKTVYDALIWSSFHGLVVGDRSVQKSNNSREFVKSQSQYAGKISSSKAKLGFRSSLCRNDNLTMKPDLIACKFSGHQPRDRRRYLVHRPRKIWQLRCHRPYTILQLNFSEKLIPGMIEQAN
ncbi:uncharacterized protein LOC133744864 [Rosa rugosa]|uniref:uncharacterized protein LOC133744864 n=1 Tax=Rosa rugosa TaxID=74645 RepID=UPI002B413313|nr:uncharacterized protein LOC133744864 [Rosa rugosa]